MEKKGLFLFLALLFVLPVLGQKPSSNSKAKIKVYYFHFTHRCITCKTVEAVSRKAVQELYPELLKKGKIVFQSYNLDLPQGKEVARSLKVSGQTLLIVSDNKSINLTNQGFMYARSNPDKLKEIIKQNIDSLLKKG